MRAVNPATGDLIKEYEDTTPEAAAAAIDRAWEAFSAWRRRPFAERAAPMRRAAEILRERAEELALLMADEMGKPLREGVAEANKCAWVCDYYAENAEHFLADEPIETSATRSRVVFRPMGVVLAVMPWNFPFWQVFRFIAPGLMAGNGGVLKHASNVPGCALAIEEIMREAGFPEGLFATVLVPGSGVADMIRHPRIAAVTLTGSTPAGKAVASTAGSVLKKTVLELGGSDPYLILDDASLEKAVPLCVAARLLNSGQSCIAAKRFIVVEAMREHFEARFVEAMGAAVMGDPTDDATTLGPMAREDLRNELHQQVLDSVAAGARVVLGGEVPKRPGAFYPATVITDVKPGMPAYDDELFGPVASVIPVANEAEAIRVANDTVFGLGAAVFTADEARGERIACDELEAGCCVVNDFVRSDPRLPFGGVKESGYGRELSHYGIKEFVNIKTVYVG